MDYGRQFPAEVISVHHTRVHPLTSLGRMGVAGITGDWSFPSVIALKKKVLTYPAMKTRSCFSNVSQSL